MRKTLANMLGAIVLVAPLAAQTFDFNTPSDDRWHYPFNFTPGVRPVGSTFGSTGTGVPAFENFNDRDGNVILAWETGTEITPGLGPDAYDIESITVTLTNESGAVWSIDLTSDAWFTFDIDNDTFVNPDGIPRGEPGDTDGESDDEDPGRPLELFGAGFGPFFSFDTWVESDPYAGGTDQGAAARDPFPFVYQDATGVMLHVEDDVDGLWNESAGVFSFTPQPWAVGVPQNYSPGAQDIPFNVTFDVDLTQSGGAVRRYFQEQLDQGRIVVFVTSMIETIELGTPGGVPSFFMKEGVGLETGALAPRLRIVLAAGIDGDLDGDGCVRLNDLAVLLSNFGTVGGVGAADGDIDGDSDVDLADLSVLLSNFGVGNC